LWLLLPMVAWLFSFNQSVVDLIRVSQIGGVNAKPNAVGQCCNGVDGMGLDRDATACGNVAGDAIDFHQRVTHGQNAQVVKRVLVRLRKVASGQMHLLGIDFVAEVMLNA
jgi:hypothetical protein